MVGETDTLSNAIAAFPAAGRRALIAAVAPQSFAGCLAARDAALIARTSGMLPDGLLLALVPLATAYARPAISEFYVGAVARGRSGALYLGANLEFPGTSLWTSLHAEQSAVARAWAHGETSIEALAVSAPPCGLCRQFLAELGPGEALAIVTPQGRATLAELLPRAFGPASLGRTAGLLDAPRRPLELAHPNSDPLVAAALDAARASYAPYTAAPAGVALRLRSGAIVSAPYAESAAHNPSMAPLAAALSQRVFAGLEGDEIMAAVLVAVGHGMIDHGGAARTLLTAVAPGVRLLLWPARFGDEG
ncbi:MAG: cytidine deaminase [Alphaproteobacteria bacterium]|nr:cytidine deaminase [Alphaproteobacteria bacterium]